MTTAVITGSASGLGAAIATALQKRGFYTIGVDQAISRSCSQNLRCDLSSYEEIQVSMKEVIQKGRADILINCAGVNHIDWLEDLPIRAWDNLMNINARAIFLMTRALLPLLIKSSGTVLNIISNASHIPMTASLAYNASKAAAHMVTLQMARELTKKYDITVFGISPAKIAGTGMSKYIEQRVPKVRGWTPEKAAEYQAAALMTGEIDPAILAEFIGFLLGNKDRHKHLSGCIIPYGG